MPGRALLFAGGVAIGVAIAGCGSAPHPPMPAPTPPAAACRLASDSVGPARSVSAVFEDSGDARRARRAASVEPPVRLDCEGRPSPGLAVAWSRDTSGRFWTLELEPAAAGAAARWTAGTVAATWRADSEAAVALRWEGVQSLVPLDDRRLTVGFASPHLELPALFADPTLGVAQDDARPAVEPIAAATDLRDAVDRGPDLIAASDPELLDYARQRPGLTTRALPWSRSYLLVLPGHAPPDMGIPSDTSAFRAGLARDAVQVEARASEAPAWWDARAACPSRGAAGPTRPAASVIVYPAADRVARGLAERLVALASRPEVTARGYSADSLALALRAGAARAFVIPVPTRALVPCRETAAWPDSATVVPLIETRAQAVLRRGAPALVAEWDGTLRVEVP